MADQKPIGEEVLNLDVAKSAKDIVDQLGEDHAVSKVIMTALAQKEHFQKKSQQAFEEGKNKLAEELAAKAKEEAEKAATAANPNPAPNVPSQPASLSVDQLLEFRKQGLSDIEIASLVGEAKNMGVQVEKFMATSLYKPWLEAERAKAKSASATPAPSGATPFPGIHTDKPVGQMSRDERKKLYNSVLDRTGVRNSGE